MGSLLSSFYAPTLPIPVKAVDLSNGDKTAIEQFRNDYRELGCAVLEIDPNFIEIATQYREICDKWLTDNNFSEKQKYIAESKDELFKELGRRPNIGYILTDHKKEYLKFKDSSSQNMFPTKEMYSKFKQLFKTWNTAAMICMDSILSESVEKSKPESELEEKYETEFESLVTKEDRDNIRKFGGIHSSISLIHYFNKICEENEEEKLSNDDKLKNRTVEVPLGIHVDTGLMVFIICSDQYGLEVLDRTTNKYYYPEKIFDPKKHVFVTAGRKMELFTWKKVIKPTWHAVRVPLEKERYTLLYFMEIQKDQ